METIDFFCEISIVYVITKIKMSMEGQFNLFNAEELALLKSKGVLIESEAGQYAVSNRENYIKVCNLAIFFGDDLLFEKLVEAAISEGACGSPNTLLKGLVRQGILSDNFDPKEVTPGELDLMKSDYVQRFGGDVLSLQMPKEIIAFINEWMEGHEAEITVPFKTFGCNKRAYL